jgi:hypothetical protein
MGYLERLKKSTNAGTGHLQNHQNPESRGFVGFEGTPPGPFQKIEGSQAANDPAPKLRPAPLPNAFVVWLIRCPDRQPVEVHFWPPATLAEALTGYPTAINAEPMQPRMAPNRSRTRRSPTKRRKPRLRPTLAAGGLALLLCRRDPAAPAGT